MSEPQPEVLPLNYGHHTMLLLATKVQQSIFYQKPLQIANVGVIKEDVSQNYLPTRLFSIIVATTSAWLDVTWKRFKSAGLIVLYFWSKVSLI